MKTFLTTPEIAKMEGVSKVSVNKWIKKGLFPNTRRVGKEYRVPIKDYYKWRESTKVIQQSA